MFVIVLYFVCLLAHSVVLASDMITYTVLSIDMLSPGITMAVLVDGNFFPLGKNATVPMMYTGSAPKSQNSYQYAVAKKNGNTALSTEEFERPAEYLSGDRSYNDVYGQQWRKIDDMNALPQLYSFEKDKYSSMGGMDDPAASNLYEDGTIATIHFRAPQEDVDKMHTYKMSKLVKLRGDFTYINYNSIQEFKNVSFKISGHSSRHWSKVPYKVKISDKAYPNGLYRRWNFKLRPESTDPTMIREKLYTDILQATGIVAARGGYARFYINNEPIGLFLISDDPSASTFIHETLYGGDKKAKIGAIIKGDAAEGTTAANLNYLGENPLLYEKEMYEIKKDSPKGKTPAIRDLIDFTRFIREYDPDTIPNDQRALKVWDEHIDITSFIRTLAVEWVTGNWDAHQYSGNNYIMHRHSAYDKYLILPVDFDFTFGNGIEEDQMNLLTGTPLQFNENRPVHSYLYDKMRLTPYLLNYYQDTIKDISTQLATPDILNARIDSIVRLIESSVEWDRSLQSRTVGLMQSQSMDDFRNSFEQGTKNKADQLIGLKQWIRIKYDTATKLFT